MTGSALATGIALFVSATFAAAGTEEGSVTLRVSRDFGTPPLLEKRVPAAGESVMSVLSRCADVRTAYGGGFVTAINGVESGSGSDWFYYVNGSMATVGAGSFITRPGDSVWWDLHPWKSARPVPSLIGSYPQPFVAACGEEAPLILYGGGMAETASRLRDNLARRGATGIRATPLSEIGKSPRAVAIYLAPWGELEKNPGISDSLRNPGERGLFVSVGPGGLRTYGLDGSPRRLFPRAGAIIALAGIFEKESPVWLVTGTEPESARRAAEILIKAPEKIEGMAGAVVTGVAVHPVPVMSPARRAGASLRSEPK